MRLCPAPREEHEGGGKGSSEGGGRIDPQADSQGAPAGASGALRGGATAVSPLRRRALFGGRRRRTLGAAPGLSWDGAGRERCVREARHPQLQTRA